MNDNRNIGCLADLPTVETSWVSAGKLHCTNYLIVQTALHAVNRSGQIGQIQGSTGPICAKGGFFSGHLARLSIDRYLQQFI